MLLVVRREMKQYYVYIMTNKSRTLYTGVTNNLQRRIYEHKNHLVKGFTNKYKITRLLYYESGSDVLAFQPPLIITRDNIDEVIDVLGEALSYVEKRKE